MALRLMTLVVATEAKAKLEQILEERDLRDCWQEEDDGHLQVNMVLNADQAEPLMDAFCDAFSEQSPFKLILLPVEAALPHPEEDEDQQPEAEQQEQQKAANRVSRDELYDEAISGSRLGRNYLLMVVLSAIVAAVGLLRDDIAIIIGAMVIAPLLMPNIALSLATTLGDLDLGKKALLCNGAGLALGLVVAAAIGLVIAVDPSINAIHSRTEVSLSDLVLALCAGAAGTLAFTAGQAGAVIGVMVAVALMPPLVACGLLAGGGHWALAGKAALLVASNLVCINLAGVGTFLLQGLGPRHWWQEDKVRKASIRAFAIWAVLLVALAALIKTLL
ncbi:MAG: TIGR00341 family protein [Pseudomonadota bacterium]|uniref:Putative hydrophobic protein (TIGR00341 family) n=1 Tax=Gallaecimonas pentaromativorans TaxID=584787 RepID=A0A3N1PDT7_9GAMM|nr:TIGR00341 family protein [Gallaecimonas pentaromativorans]MED5525143.1 TIGR00341 family protein [Pseudomonadota bacterium]ROQ22676.1 putative hydrophobic protein (TIGR00341 family) [Gallaecimonas pentaromativorans]